MKRAALLILLLAGCSRHDQQWTGYVVSDANRALARGHFGSEKACRAAMDKLYAQSFIVHMCGEGCPSDRSVKDCTRTVTVLDDELRPRPQ